MPEVLQRTQVGVWRSAFFAQEQVNVVGLFVVSNKLPNNGVRQTLSGLRLPAKNTVFGDGFVEYVIALLLAKCHEENPIAISSRNPNYSLESPSSGLRCELWFR